MTRQSTPRQNAILRALSSMLEEPAAGRITTAALAKRLNQSEAALYRHYSSKEAMFQALIALIGAQILEDLEDIVASENSGAARLRKQVHALLFFVERHPGSARLLTGIALAGEAHTLQVHVNKVLDAVADALEQSARAAFKDDPDNGDAQKLVAGMLMDWVQGRWLRFAHSGWQEKPTDKFAEHLRLLGL